MAATEALTLHSGAGRAWWRTVQVFGVAATVVLIAGLVMQPEIALGVLWNVLIPILPASFLVAPGLWRGVCPLATLNLSLHGLAGRRKLSSRAASNAELVGIVLLVVLVPARRFLFNQDGLALAATISAVAVGAVMLGAFFDAKAGFCNSLCPVLPVEKLYGQHPMLVVRNPRCHPCTLCVPRGCIDLAPARSISQSLGESRTPQRWLMTVHGAFAAAFPGFVVGYYTTENGPLSTAPAVYLQVAAWAVGSYLATMVVVRMLRVPPLVALAFSAAIAVAVYYWFAAPLVASALGLTGAGVFVLRGSALALVVLWLCRAWVRSSTPRTNGGFEPQ